MYMPALIPRIFKLCLFAALAVTSVLRSWACSVAWKSVEVCVDGGVFHQVSGVHQAHREGGHGFPGWSHQDRSVHFSTLVVLVGALGFEVYLLVVECEAQLFEGVVVVQVFDHLGDVLVEAVWRFLLVLWVSKADSVFV